MELIFVNKKIFNSEIVDVKTAIYGGMSKGQCLEILHLFLVKNLYLGPI